MKQLTFSAFALLLSASAALAEDCSAPDVPTLPDGASATMEQMLEGQKAVKTFQAANLAYMQCLEPALSAAEMSAKEGAEGAEEAYRSIEERYNAAVSLEEEVAGQFNTEIREYKAANPS